MQVWPAPLLQEKLPPLRRNALQPREIQRRSVVNDVLWRVTVHCLTQLHTLKIVRASIYPVDELFLAASKAKMGDPGRFLCVTIGVVGGAVVTYACRVGVRGAMTLTPTEVSLLHTINARKHLLEFHKAAFIQ
ncbi:unnamed protein product, partial [Aphanomyces euteiches]